MLTLATGMRLTPSPNLPNVFLGAKLMAGTQRGFSLVELLVAVFVVVLLTGVVSLSVGRGGADLTLESEVRHVAGLLSFASAEAGLSAADHGLFIGEDVASKKTRYRATWLRRFDQGWVAPQNRAEVFRPLSLAEGYKLRLSLDGQPEVELVSFDPELNPSPQVVAWAGGEMTPGSLEWSDPRTGELLYRLQWDLLGRMTLMPKGVSSEVD